MNFASRTLCSKDYVITKNDLGQGIDTINGNRRADNPNIGINRPNTNNIDEKADNSGKNIDIPDPDRRF